MKAYGVPFQQRLMILAVLGFPFAFQGGKALAVFFPLAMWMIWGDWRVVQVNHQALRFRSSWFGGWREVSWGQVDRALWVGFDTACLHLSDGESVTVSYAGLSDSERSEVAGWINHCCWSGLERVGPSRVIEQG